MIELTKDKIIYTNQYNPNYYKYVKKEVEKLSPYLNEVVKLSDDFTLADLFGYIERELNIFDVIFSSQLGHYPLQLYIDEIKKPGPKEDDEIDYLEIQRYGERWEWGEIDLFIDFRGVNEKTDMGYALDFTPVNELKHLPLRLNESFEISEMKIPSKIVRFAIRIMKKIGIPLKKWDNPFSYVHVRGKVDITVCELMSAILYEISFYGGPEERDVKLAEIEEDVDEMKKCVEGFPIW